MRRRVMALVQSAGETMGGWRGWGRRQVIFAWVVGRRERRMVRMVVGRCMVRDGRGLGSQVVW